MKPDEFIAFLTRRMQLPRGGVDFKESIESFRSEMLKKTIEHHHWNLTRAAKFLHLKRSSLAAMLNKAHIYRPYHMKDE